MRCLIRTDCGGSHGLGRASRCRVLAHALVARGAEVHFVTTTPALAGFVAPFVCHNGDTEAGYALPADIFVYDHSTEVPDWAWRCKLRHDGYKLVCIDYPVGDDFWDLMVFPNGHQPPAMLARLEADFPGRVLHGWNYVMLDAAVTQHHPVPYAARQDSRIVFCAGGSDPDGALERMYAWSEELLPEVEKVFLVGAQSQGPLAQELGGRPWVAEMTARLVLEPFDRNHLRDAALVVGFLGQITYESLFYQTPMLCYGRTEADAEAVWQLVRASQGAIRGAGPWELGAAERFAAMVNPLWKYVNMRQHMAAASAGLIDGRGVERVADAMLQLADV